MSVHFFFAYSSHGSCARRLAGWLERELCPEREVVRCVLRAGDGGEGLHALGRHAQHGGGARRLGGPNVVDHAVPLRLLGGEGRRAPARFICIHLPSARPVRQETLAEALTEVEASRSPGAVGRWRADRRASGAWSCCPPWPAPRGRTRLGARGARAAPGPGSAARPRRCRCARWAGRRGPRAASLAGSSAHSECETMTGWMVCQSRQAERPSQRH